MPEAERLGKEIAGLEALYPDYDERNNREKALRQTVQDLQSECKAKEEAEEKAEKLSGETEKLKAEQKNLENAGAKKEALNLTEKELQDKKAKLAAAGNLFAEWKGLC